MICTRLGPETKDQNQGDNFPITVEPCGTALGYCRRSRLSIMNQQSWFAQQTRLHTGPVKEPKETIYFGSVFGCSEKPHRLAVVNTRILCSAMLRLLRGLVSYRQIRRVQSFSLTTVTSFRDTAGQERSLDGVRSTTRRKHFRRFVHQAR
jgi:hypothetical protein